MLLALEMAGTGCGLMRALVCCKQEERSFR